MNPIYQDVFSSVIKFITNRVFAISLVVLTLFGLITAKLFDIQVVNAHLYVKGTRQTYVKTTPIEAPRGNIYDRFGRPLAYNETTFSVSVDPSIKVSNTLEVVTLLLDILKMNNETFIDELPISKTEPYEFLMNGSKSREERFKEDMSVDKSLNATETFKALRENFKVPEHLTDEEARDIVALYAMIYLERYNLNHITVAKKVSDYTVAAIEEHNMELPGVYVDVDYLRIYPAGETFSHTLGYIRKISAEELELYEPRGYKATDIVGKVGVEKAFELQLRGTQGSREIETDRSGRRISILSETNPVPGNDVYLTLDMDYHKQCYDIIVKMLKTILVNKLSGKSPKETIPLKEVFISMTKSGTINIDDVLLIDEEDLSYSAVKPLIDNFQVPNSDAKFKQKFTDYFVEQIDKGKIAPKQIIYLLNDLGIVTINEEELKRLNNGQMSPLSFVLRKIENDELTPQIINLNPSTASAVVVDINTGAVLAAPSYPTYDNTQFVNVFNNEYFNKVNNDLTHPLIFRSFSETRAPGSAFKMISALAGLEEGAIRIDEKIRDEGAFTKAGKPYPHCWTSASGYHGTINVSSAIEVSCNYFFFETSYRLGNSKEGTKMEGINTLNRYMSMFGLGVPTGIEISEAATYISSPEYKEAQMLRSGATLSQSEWVDGDTQRTAIGQAFNSYSTATMAKYFATLANGGTRYQLHFLDKLKSPNGETLVDFQPNPEIVLNFKEENLAAVKQGMLAVTSGSRGTGRSAFAGFPIAVAGKTGTAQESGEDHATFGGYAPADNPKIAVFVAIPFGDTLTAPAPAAQVARDMIGAYFKLNQEPEIPEQTNVLIK